MLTDRVTFGPFDTNLKTGELRRDGRGIPLQDLPFRLLTALLERPGELVTRAELTERLWGAGTFVDSAAGLNTAVAKLRDALGDNAEQPLYIETVPKRGYRFVGTISPAEVETSRSDPGRPGGSAGSASTKVAQGVPPTLAVDSNERRRDTLEREGSSPASARLKPRAMLTAAVLAVIAVIGLAAYQLRASRPQTRVAVILFDNETGRPELSRLSQGLTDAAVFALTAQPKLAVIGNAAILRTARPFRDVAAVRDALHADYIVFGQVQTVDQTILVRSHLIRGSDQAHVWVSVSRMTGDEATLQAEVGGRIAAAVSTRVP